MPDQNQSAEFKAATSANNVGQFRGSGPWPGGVRPFLSKSEEFGNVSRGNPVPHTLDPAALTGAGLTPETWRLTVTADPFAQEHHVKVGATIATPLDLNLAALKALGEKHGTVKIVKAMQCMNVDAPLGQV